MLSMNTSYSLGRSEEIPAVVSYITNTLHKQLNNTPHNIYATTTTIHNFTCIYKTLQRVIIVHVHVIVVTGYSRWSR